MSWKDRTPHKILLSILVIGLALSAVDAQTKRSKTKGKITTVATYTPQTPDGRRRQVEERMLKGEYQHDGSGELRYIGTIESVPALLRVLKDNPPYILENDIPPPPPLPGQPAIQARGPLVVCTYHHALTALRKITGQNLSWYEEWLVWWEKYQTGQGKTSPK